MARGALFDPGGDHRDANLALEIGIEGAAPDDVGVFIDQFADVVRRLVDFEQAHILAADDRDDHAAGAGHADTVEQRIGDRLFGSRQRAVFALAFAGAHHRLTHLAHHRTHVGKIEVDEARHDHQIGDRPHTLLEHFVGKLEGFLEGGFGLGDQEQVLVGDDDQRVDVALQFLDPGFGRAHAAGALEQERFGDNADGEHAHAARRFGDDRRGAGAGAPAHAGRDEAHVDALECALDIGDGFFGCGLAHFGPRACAKAAGDVGPELDALFGRAGGKRLCVGIGDDELDALDLGRDHVGDGIAARAADPDHSDARTQVIRSGRSDIDAHQLVLQAQESRILSKRPTLFFSDTFVVYIL